MDDRVPGRAERVAEAAVAAVGFVHLWTMLVVRAGGSFHLLLAGLPLPLLATVLTWRWLGGSARPALLSVTPSSTAIGLAAAAAVALWGWYGRMIPWVAAWSLLLVAMGAFAGLQPREPTLTAPRRSWLAAVLVAGAAAAVLTLVVDRPDGDDGYYLGQVAGTLAHPDLPVLGFDVMHGDVTAPVQQPAHRAQSFEVLVAALAFLVPIGHEWLYYGVLPAVFSALFALTAGLLAREVVGERAAVPAVLASVVLAALWGGLNPTPGNFAMARMFQGKAVFATVWMPLVVWAALRFADRLDARSWALLALAIFGASSFTSSALVAAPVGAAFAVLAALRPDRSAVRAAAGGLLAALPSVVSLLLVKLDVDAAGIPPHFSRTYDWVDFYGPGARVPLSFGLLALLPAFARTPWAARYVLVVFFLLLNGVTADRLGTLSSLFEWRIYWSVPTLAILGASLGGLAIWSVRRVPVGAVLAVLFLVAFGRAGPWVGDRQSRASWGWPHWDRVEDGCAIAARAIAHDRVHPALLHRDAAICATAWLERPPLIGVRQFYLEHLYRHIGEEEGFRRVKLLRFVDGNGKRRNAPWVLDELDRRCVVSLAFDGKASERLDTDALTARGWREELVAGDLQLWVRDSCEPPGVTSRPPAD
ncbi:MAG: hypothetical protein H6736_15840 [Alphaproteobacteria bacterium]|nr:hypothetical protein [Alphaproteobacteria bacterium]MCB9693283.1 hypothetical protein [Alphaproteobacteria bacterium]